MNETFIKQLEEKRAELLRQAEAIALVIAMYKTEPPPAAATPVAAPVKEHAAVTAAVIDTPPLTSANATVIEKILAIIKHEGRFLYRKEIIDLAEKHKIPFSGAITSALSMANSKPDSELALYLYQQNAGVWGLKAWMNEGEIIPGRRHKDNEEYKKR